MRQSRRTCLNTVFGLMLVVPGGTVLRVRRWTLKFNGEADSSVVAAVTERPFTFGIISGAA